MQDIYLLGIHFSMKHMRTIDSYGVFGIMRVSDFVLPPARLAMQMGGTLRRK